MPSLPGCSSAKQLVPGGVHTGCAPERPTAGLIADDDESKRVRAVPGKSHGAAHEEAEVLAVSLV